MRNTCIVADIAKNQSSFVVSGQVGSRNPLPWQDEPLFGLSKIWARHFYQQHMITLFLVFGSGFHLNQLWIHTVIWNAHFCGSTRTSKTSSLPNRQVYKLKSLFISSLYCSRVWKHEPFLRPFQAAGGASLELDFSVCTGRQDDA